MQEDCFERACWVVLLTYSAPPRHSPLLGDPSLLWRRTESLTTSVTPFAL